ncbi:aromatic amino acid transporter [Ignatzschineria rhizosphaerae]|uniref:Aromatic amino acid permease n=1 Tax=Ignatzschineria rhizosphaerae TaxID=2923279 RepID=A0ABY3X8F4_9GAMM|nr:aromatic amino acid transport family protein [Ignatzschineria rhizosphaerae]UNM97006.1 aromatic amino acid transporter [Ignatzschineria rhizosphaerae]
MKVNKSPTVLGGAMIAAGTMIGAGMLSLPIASAGMWFGWTVVIMLITVLFMYVTAEQILEVNLGYNPGSSFDTLVKSTLGDTWRLINGFSVAFVLYILLYAYVVGSGSVISDTLRNLEDNPIDIPRYLSSLLFSIVFTAIVWWSTKAVDRISTILMVGMFITLFAAVTGLLGQIHVDYLFEPTGESQYAIYAFASLPFFLTSFCFHASVPSFVKYYGIEGSKIRKAIIWGMIITFVFYLCWMIAIMGSIDRVTFLSVGEDEVAWLLNQVKASDATQLALRIFAFFAVVTSFLGAGLGLFDYIADLFKIGNSAKSRLLTATITFLPPTILGMIFPNGFVLAIGFAGLFAAIWSVIVPALMVINYRKRQKGAKEISFRAFGGKVMPYIIIAYGLIAITSHLLVTVFKVDALSFI